MFHRGDQWKCLLEPGGSADPHGRQHWAVAKNSCSSWELGIPTDSRAQQDGKRLKVEILWDIMDGHETWTFLCIDGIIAQHFPKTMVGKAHKRMAFGCRTNRSCQTCMFPVQILALQVKTYKTWLIDPRFKCSCQWMPWAPRRLLLVDSWPFGSQPLEVYVWPQRFSCSLADVVQIDRHMIYPWGLSLKLFRSFNLGACSQFFVLYLKILKFIEYINRASGTLNSIHSSSGSCVNSAVTIRGDLKGRTYRW